MSINYVDKAYADAVVIASVSLKTLRNELQAALLPYGLDVDDFLKSDLDSHTDAGLRDLWLMAKGLLEPQK